MAWYYSEAGQQTGPIDDGQLEQLMQSGRIQSETLVWQEGMPNWQP
jgi:type IV pilus assembly protein PilA